MSQCILSVLARMGVKYIYLLYMWVFVLYIHCTCIIADRSTKVGCTDIILWSASILVSTLVGIIYSKCRLI